MDRPQPSAVGTQRRLMALMNRSWAPEAIERVSGIPAAEITSALAARQAVSPGLAARVAGAYDRLWDKQPPRVTRADRELAEAARVHAQRLGWPPPLAYDDDLIDRPGGDAQPGWKRSGGQPSAAPILSRTSSSSVTTADTATRRSPRSR